MIMLLLLGRRQMIKPSSLERKSGGNEVEVGSQMQRP